MLPLRSQRFSRDLMGITKTMHSTSELLIHNICRETGFTIWIFNNTSAVTNFCTQNLIKPQLQYILYTLTRAIVVMGIIFNVKNFETLKNETFLPKLSFLSFKSIKLHF